MLVILKRCIDLIVGTYTAYVNKRKTRVEYFTRMIVAEVVPSAWPLAMLIPSTFNLHRWNIKIISCAYKTNHIT
jgi:hypothetical protein